MQVSFDRPLTAMQLREKVLGFTSLCEVIPVIFVKGYFDDRYGIDWNINHTVRVIKLGTRYLTVMVDNQIAELKPESIRAGYFMLSDADNL